MKLTLWQTEPIHDPHAAMAALAVAARDARAAGSDLLVAPEAVLGGYNIGAARFREMAKRSDSHIEKLSAIAADYGIALVIGLPQFYGDSVRNAAVLIDPMGALLTTYHKTHQFGDIDRAQFQAGTTMGEITELNGWRIALAICYDIEFPETARFYADRGADLIIVPTANMAPFDGVSKRLVPARAEENALYVAYANYVGGENGLVYNGGSVVIAPDGEDVIRAGDAAGLYHATLDRAHLDNVRQRQHHLHDRRRDLYT